MRIGARLGSGTRERGSLLILLLLLMAVLMPTACVLWFTNRTIDIQRETARRKLIDAYRFQMTLVRDGLEVYWDKRRAELGALSSSGEAPTIFARAISTGAADAVICLNRDGSPAYPSVRIRIAADPIEHRQDWMMARELENQGADAGAAAAHGGLAETEKDPSLKARALQAQVRSLRRMGQTQTAISIIRDQLIGGPAVAGVDLQDRLISADAQLLSLQLMKPSTPGYIEAARRLAVICWPTTPARAFPHLSACFSARNCTRF